MLKRRSLIVIVFVALIIVSAVVVPLNLSAQTETPTETITPTPDVGIYKGGYEKAYKDYLNQVETYRDAHQEYVLRKSQYQRFKTLQSQQDAQEATVAMLKERDRVVISYFIALKERLREQGKADESTTSELNIQIDDQIGWFTDHEAKVPSAGSLEDLEKDSKEASKQFSDASPLIYSVLGTISSGRLTDMRERLDDKFTELKDKLDEIRLEDREDYKLSSEKLQQLDRWIFDSELRIQRFSEKQDEAEVSIFGLNDPTKKRSAARTYNEAIQTLFEAQQFLRESSSYMLEILREIRTAED